MKTVTHHIGYCSRRMVSAIGLGGLLVCASVNAFDGLNEAQSLVYDTAHLTNTEAEQVIDYRYSSEMRSGARIEDDVKITILAAVDDERRDLSVEFLSEERALALPTFEGYRGNPVIIAMLEHIAQSISSETGGGTLYFRNRIRDAMAGDTVQLSDVQLSLDGGSEFSARVLSFQPFVGDEYLGTQEQYADATVSIVLSDEVPAGIVSVGVESAINDDDVYFRRELVLSQ